MSQRHEQLRIAYLVSRFPLATETFILRELMAVDARTGGRCELLSLFNGDSQALHVEQEAWIERRRQASLRGALRGAFYWLLRRPARLASTTALTIADQLHDPRRLGRSVAALALALDHARALNEDPVDHVHAHFATYPALAAWTIRRLTGIPYSVTPHAHDIFVWTAGLRRRLDASAFVVAISAFHRGFLSSFTGTEVNTPVIRCGLELGRYQYRDPQVAPPASGQLRAICVAAFRDYKGHRFLIEAMADPRLERCRLTLVGDGQLRPEIESQIAARGLEGRVTLVGSLSQEELSRLLLEQHLYVQPSIVAENGDTEGLPVSLIEAAAVGLPLVATDVAGISDLVEDGYSGLLIQPGSSVALADGIADSLADTDAARDRAREARKRVERRHDIEAIADQLVELFGSSASAAS